ncbi:hypothetical protein CI102_6029 [Trichoderma harzianum]|nr:hypothetical protein CI102_6029 [Trichoderma harzianum]
MAPISADGDIRDLAYPGGIFLEGYRRWWWNELVLPVKLPNTEVEDYVGGLRSHPWDDEYYYGNGALSANFSSIDIPVLTAVSMTNTIHPRSGFEAFSSLSSRVKRLMVMDAVYSGNMYKDFQPDLEAFFDQYLKGKKLAEEPPTVRMVLRTGDGGWQWRLHRPGLSPVLNIASCSWMPQTRVLGTLLFARPARKELLNIRLI